MKHIPQISEAEYEVMKVIWKYAPISTNDITDKLLQTTSWNPRTIQTLIKRLSDKSAISYEKNGRMFVYSPVISQEEYRKHESSSFLKKFFNGHISDMVSAFVDSDELSADDINELFTGINGITRRNSTIYMVLYLPLHVSCFLNINRTNISSSREKLMDILLIKKCVKNSVKPYFLPVPFPFNMS